MEKINDGGPAFPDLYQDSHSGAYQHHNGMSLRDYFAGQALSGLCANQDVKAMYKADIVDEQRAKGVDNSYAKIAYRLTDAMIKARTQGGGG